MLLQIVMLAFCCINFVATTNTNQACGHHVNTSWNGNSSCLHSRDSECKVHVTCGLRTITQLDSLIASPEVVVSLDISKSGLEELKEHMFYKYKHLVSLNLSYNTIREIQRNAFDGLTNLKTLDLSFNFLQKWVTMDITKQLPSLTKLSITGNPFWLPGQHIRDLPNISLIRGIASYTLPYDNNQYFICHLRKQPGTKKGGSNVDLVTVNIDCIKLLFYFEANFSAIWNSNFYVFCTRHYCKSPSFNRTASKISVEFIDFCFQGIQTWGLPNIPIGLVTMIVNFVVMATVVLTASLFKKANMVLIASMALGDFLQGLWLAILSIVRYSMSSLEFIEKKMPYLCYSLLALFLTAQSLSVLASFIVTVERYLCIVYSTKPNIRITRRIAVVLLVFVALFICGFAITPAALKLKYGRGDYSCINVHTVNNEPFVQYVSYLGVIPYIISYILYARIFYTVRRSSLNAGIQREGKLAKRIITVLTTNLLFLFGPIIAGQILALNGETVRTNMICWNAVLLWFLGINSIFNPVLYAFRIEKFRRSLKRLIRGRRNEVGAAASNN